MKQRFCFVCVSMICILACACCFAGCADNSHTHSYAQTWSTDATHHWHACAGCDDKADYAAHDFSAGNCVCGTPDPTPSHTHIWASIWNSDATHHWHDCAGCDAKSDYATHDFSTGNCVCGRQKPPVSHTHDWASAWSSDRDAHWHSCNGCAATTDRAPHAVGDDGRCTTCGYLADPTYTEGLAYTPSADRKSYIVSGIGSATDPHVSIPSDYEGLPVTQIGANAFKNVSSLVSVSLPDTIVEIGNYAFAGCNNLTRATVCDGLQRIGD